MSETLTHRLKAVENGVRELERDTRRRLATPIVEEAVSDGRIAAGDETRWLERSEKLGVDTVRDLLLERKPDQTLARANAAAEISAEQDAQLVEAFPGYEGRA
jgi:hypothetical protein